MNKLVVITGPTATGKTKLGIELAQKFDGEILSADSRQVYKGKDIETGKDKELFEAAGVPVWGLDLVDPGDNFNVSAFVRYGQNSIADIVKRGKLPIVVGGAGLYIKALIKPFETINIPPDEKLRRQNLSREELQRRLQQVDLLRWQGMNASDQKNPRRLIRAIETSSQDQKPKTKGQRYDALIIGLTAPREHLYQKINARIEERIKKGVERDRESWESFEHAYARRQMTFLRKLAAIKWFDITISGYQDEILAEVKKWYIKSSDRKKNQASN